MIVECLSCGSKNRLPNVFHSNGTYRCGSCKAPIGPTSVKPLSKALRVFVSIAFGVLAAFFAIPFVALIKAITPLFGILGGTAIETYILDPILYFICPLVFGYKVFQEVMNSERIRAELAPIACGVIAGIIAAICTMWGIPFRNYRGPVRWILILAQFPIIPFGFGYFAYRVALYRKLLGLKA
jgi:hypothetical protein